MASVASSRFNFLGTNLLECRVMTLLDIHFDELDPAYFLVTLLVMNRHHQISCRLRLCQRRSANINAGFSNDLGTRWISDQDRFTTSKDRTPAWLPATGRLRVGACELSFQSLKA
jgi:hypothetical protein